MTFSLVAVSSISLRNSRVEFSKLLSDKNGGIEDLFNTAYKLKHFYTTNLGIEQSCISVIFLPKIIKNKDIGILFFTRKIKEESSRLCILLFQKEKCI